MNNYDFAKLNNEKNEIKNKYKLFNTKRVV